ncbi:MAG: hypothetical protein LQ338_000639 [Usnochroma carphineum]|nr:MAG: hypothetical protein LQ338_000639 [Usnochroma carphineum]
MASLTQTEPSLLGGEGRQMDVANQHYDTTFGGLRGRTFRSCCPPDVQPNTRIIAICGITDYTGPETVGSSSGDKSDTRPKPVIRKIVSKTKDLFSGSRRQARKDIKPSPQGLAAPKKDGWFFSDFFLFYHLFRGFGAHQLWITSEQPQRLVEKYTEYIHGEPGERRVVLGADKLSQIQADNNISMFERGRLLQDFLSTFESECKIAAQNDQPVLLLIFGHGDGYTHGVSIGGTDGGIDAPRLQIRQFQSILRGLDVSATLLMTSCFSGGWIYQPDLNVCAATASGPENEALSWAKSIGGRFHGSSWATAVTNAFIQSEDERLMQHHPQPTNAIDLEDIRTSNTFVKLAEVIHNTLVNNVDCSNRGYYIRFAAQDDTWATEWRQRSGVPLASFRKRWQELRRRDSPQPSSGPSQSRTGRGQSSVPPASASDDTQGEYGCKKGISRRQALSVVQQSCLVYLNSFPGVSNRASNTTVHALANALINGERLGHWQIQELHLTLLHRMNLMKWATAFKSFLALDFKDCNLFDVDEWEATLVGKGKGKAQRDDANMKFQLYDKCRSMVRNARLFPPPPVRQGHGLLLGLSYPKPTDYLAAALTQNGRSADNIGEAWARLVQCELPVRNFESEAL